MSSEAPAHLNGLAMFPLGNVLFPGMPLVLHVFEPRYRAMVRFCMNGDQRMGVVLIARGSEVGGGDIRHRVGTVGRIVDAVEFEDGRWGIGLLGEERIRVERWLPDDPFPRAEVVGIGADDPTPGDLGARQELERVLRRVLAMQTELGDPAPSVTVEVSQDSVQCTWQAAVLGGIGPADCQKILEVDDAAERLALVTLLLEDEATALAQRVAEG